MALSKIIKRAGIPEPYPDVESLHASVTALKVVVEEITRQRGKNTASAVTVEDLIELGLVERREGGRVVLPETGSS